jgi:hypothetical protein
VVQQLRQASLELCPFIGTANAVCVTDIRGMSWEPESSGLCPGTWRRSLGGKLSSCRASGTRGLGLVAIRDTSRSVRAGGRCVSPRAVQMVLLERPAQLRTGRYQRRCPSALVCSHATTQTNGREIVREPHVRPSYGRRLLISVSVSDAHRR